MTKEQFRKTEALTPFEKRCLDSKLNPEVAEAFGKLWRKAKTEEEFIKEFLVCEQVKNSQAYTVISKNHDIAGHWYRVREMLGARCFKTVSDAGSVKIGMGSGYTLIFNDYGDGETRVGVFAKDEPFNTYMMNYTGVSVSGEIAIYDYDCGDSIIKELKGTYSIFVYEGIVAFVER